MSPAVDRVVRVMTVDGSLRLIALSLRETTTAIASIHGAENQQARTLAELIAAAVLVREIVAPDKRVQMTLVGPASSLVAESRPDGACRAFIDSGVGVEGRSGPLLQVAYHRHGGQLHQSTIAIPSTADVAEALMAYLQTSEQIISTVGIASRSSGSDLVAHAYAVQLLPSAEVGTLETVTQILEEGDMFTGSPDPMALIERIRGDIEVAPLADSTVRFECTCSRERVVATLANLAPADLVEMIAAGTPTEIRCDACNQVYVIEVAELSGLLARNPDAGEN